MPVAERPRTIAPRPAATRRGAPAATRPPLAVVVLLPVALALALGLWGLRRQGGMWRDEAATYEMAHRSLPGLLRTVADYDVVHGLYYVLMHGVFAAFGDGVVALRMPSVLATAAAAAGVALLGRRLAGPGAGLAAGMVFPLLPDVQRYAQEGRSYALVCAGVVWATLLLLRAVEARRTGAWAAYAAVALGVCLLHEFAVLAVLAHGVGLLAARVRRGVLRAWGVAAGCVGAGLAPLAVISIGQAKLVDWIGGPGAGTYMGLAAVAGLGLGCAAVAGRPVAPVALPLLLVPKAALLLLSAVKPLYVERYVLYSYSALALLLGAAAQALWRRRGPVRWYAAVAGVVAAVVLVGPVRQHVCAPERRVDDLASIAAAVRAHAEPGDGVLFTPASRRIWMRPEAPAYDGLTDLAQDADPSASHSLYGTELPPQAIRARILAARRILVLHDPAGSSLSRGAGERVKRAALRAHFEVCASTEAQGGRVTVYARPGAC
ncbi:glycosyltransferase family 39 protein [Streptomyces boninensis]|uniref:glycosyltransferase family 39 protein n=1 Tax=Streptomyces boninensis TaxID=2039455 RepID=UPI003B210248